MERRISAYQPHWTDNHKTVHDGERGAWNWYEITWPSREFQGRGRTLALAACASFLRALQARQETSEDE